MAEAKTVSMQVRMKPQSLARIDQLAHDLDWTRSQVMRTLFALGLKAWEKGERP